MPGRLCGFQLAFQPRRLPHELIDEAGLDTGSSLTVTQEAVHLARYGDAVLSTWHAPGASFSAARRTLKPVCWANKPMLFLRGRKIRSCKSAYQKPESASTGYTAIW